MIAIEHSHKWLVEMLLAHPGIDIDIKNKEGKDAIACINLNYSGAEKTKKMLQNHRKHKNFLLP